MPTFYKVVHNRLNLSDSRYNAHVDGGMRIITAQTSGAESICLTNDGDATDDNTRSIPLKPNSVGMFEGMLSASPNDDTSVFAAGWNVRIVAKTNSTSSSIIQSQFTEIAIDDIFTGLSVNLKTFTNRNGLYIVANGIAGYTLDWSCFLNYKISTSKNNN